MMMKLQLRLFDSTWEIMWSSANMHADNAGFCPLSVDERQWQFVSVDFEIMHPEHCSTAWNEFTICYWQGSSEFWDSISVTQTKVDSCRAFVLFVLLIHDRAEPVMDLQNVCYLTCSCIFQEELLFLTRHSDASGNTQVYKTLTSIREHFPEL